MAKIGGKMIKRIKEIYKKSMETMKENKKRTVAILLILAIVGGVVGVGTSFIIEERKAVAEFEEKLMAKEKELAEAKEDLEAVDDEVTTYTTAQLWDMDLSKPSGVTEEELAPLLQGGTVGLEDTFIEAEEKYGVNAIFLVSIAALESAWGTINFRPNNMFGYGTSGYETKEDNVMTVAKGLGENYLSPSGSLYSGNTATGVNARYASSSKWDDKIITQMKKLYDEVAYMQEMNILHEKEIKAQKVLELENEIAEMKEKEEKREKLWFVG